MKYSVSITPTVIKKDGTKVEYKTQKNMITDYGLSRLSYGRGFSSMLNYFHIGGGNTPNFRSSVGDTISCNITTMTSTVPLFTQEDADNKREVQLWDNTTCRIVTFTSTTEVEVDTEITFVNKGCRIWNTETVALENWITYSDTNTGVYLTDFGTSYEDVFGGAGNTYLKVSVFRTKRFDFIDAGATIKEVGYSDSSSGTINLCGRLVLDNPIVVQTAEMLFLKIEATFHVPYGEILADPVFGVPAIVSYSWNAAGGVIAGLDYIDSANSPRNINNERSPLSLGIDTFGLKLYHNAGTSTKSSTVSTSTTKPYYKQFGALTWTYSPMTDIYQIVIGDDASPTAHSYNLIKPYPSVGLNQLLRITPEQTIKRVLTPYPGTGSQDPQPIASDFANVTGLKCCIGILTKYSDFKIDFGGYQATVVGTKIYATDQVASNGGDVFEMDLDGSNNTSIISGISGTKLVFYDGSELLVPNSYHSSHQMRRYQLDGTLVGSYATPTFVKSMFQINGKTYIFGYDDVLYNPDHVNGVYNPATDLLSMPADWYVWSHEFSGAFITLSEDGHFRGHDKTTGDVLWDHPTGHGAFRTARYDAVTGKIYAYNQYRTYVIDTFNYG